MKRKPNGSKGQITIFWQNAQEYSTQTFHTLDGAIAYTSSISRDAKFELDDVCLGYWSTVSGFRPARKMADSVTPMQYQKRKAV